ncbi:MAG TPA: tRNA (adenosine(37)-N6)-threonylcarbamoyltransferase complex ATPase subunit type 1 TsaE [Myxococcales bacterium]|nr:tRNA (adenosine(37)-N6)-threonylcarbamoyltransferase complex ATPase subunit type 1 TsaE [Myxococcales bacterium]
MGPLAPAASREFRSRSPEETRALGAALGRVLQPGDFVGLAGELGAGKTAFIRGAAEGAGVPAGEVSSPSFAIVYPYRGRLLLHHADLYRLADEDELYATGFYDLLPHGAALVEWLDRIPRAAPEDFLRLDFTVLPDESRRILASASGPRHAELLRRWVAALNVAGP